MKKLHFDYYMQIDYSVVVSRCNFTIKCIPQNNARQTVETYQIELYPNSSYNYGEDGLGNRQIYGLDEVPHKTFYFRIIGEVLTGKSDYEEAEDDNKTMIFRHPHGLNMPGPKIKAFFEQIPIKEGLDTLTVTKQLMEALRGEFRYQPNTTTVKTTAEEAFAQGHGVCQDYAHILISLLHLAGIPARYVTGLLIGEGASHAWVEVLHEGYWYGFDPTNGVRVSDQHIKIGIGRDANDCMINRGIMHGGGLHAQCVKVSVKEEESI